MGDEERTFCLQLGAWNAGIYRFYHRAHQVLESLVGDVEGEERWDRLLYCMSQVREMLEAFHLGMTARGDGYPVEGYLPDFGKGMRGRRCFLKRGRRCTR